MTPATMTEAGPDSAGRTRVSPRTATDEPRCRVWVADVERADPAPAGEVLDSAERARAARYLRPSDRARFVLGVGLLKHAVADREGRASTAVHVSRHCAVCGAAHGAPRVVGSDQHVSVAHSGSLVVVAVTSVGPVGIDVEQCTPRSVMPRRRDVLTLTEVLLQPDDFFTYWCRKESVLKATGVGLTVSMLDVVVSPASAPAQLVSYRGAAAPAVITDLDLAPGYAAAVTVLTSEHVSVGVGSADALW